jgi:hypothetical protein
MTTAPTGFPLPLRNALAALAIEALDDPAARAALAWLAATPAESAPPTVRADLAAHHLVEADGTLVDVHRPHEARMRAHAERELRAADAFRASPTPMPSPQRSTAPSRSERALFFEVHEVLEAEWKRTSGEVRQACRA